MATKPYSISIMPNISCFAIFSSETSSALKPFLQLCSHSISSNDFSITSQGLTEDFKSRMSPVEPPVQQIPQVCWRISVARCTPNCRHM